MTVETEVAFPTSVVYRTPRRIRSMDRLIIRSMPGFDTQLHMHTDPTGNYINAAHIKTSDGLKIKLTGYEASMADFHADRLGMARIVRDPKP